MKITFFGGVGEVTGSRHLFEHGNAKVLLDCGLYQGHRAESTQRNRTVPFDPKSLTAALLSHAHMDHCGNLPMLVKKGYGGKIHCTPPTVDLCGIVLMDSAHIQVEDAKFFNKIHQQDGQSIEPIYDEEDVRRALERFTGHAYGEPVAAGDGVTARFVNAGHILGSAMIVVEAGQGAAKRRVLFTGDLGRRKTLLMAPPEVPEKLDYVLIESTYGDRLHEPIEHAAEQLKEVICRVVEEKGRLLIPSFAMERTQEIVFVVEKLFRDGKIPRIPLYVDSPMAVSISEVFNRNLKGFFFSDDFKEYVAKAGDPFAFQTVRYTRTSEESKRINDMDGPMIIISASGMCEGGRILHHLRNNIDKDNTTILLVGYQAEGTLGRRLQEGAKKVKIFGLEHEVAAQVQTMHTFSSHADRDDILAFIGAMDPKPKKIFLVHGDTDQRAKLEAHMTGLGWNAVSPEFGDTFELE